MISRDSQEPSDGVWGLIFGDKFTAIIRYIRESCYDFCSTEGFLLCIFFFINKFKGEIMPHYLPILL